MSEQAIYAQLAAVPALGDRVYALVLPQNVIYPAASYQRISATRYSAFGADASPVEATIQVDLYGQKSAGYGAFNILATAVRQALQRVRGVSLDMFIDAERDDYEEQIYRKTYDVRVWYRE